MSNKIVNTAKQLLMIADDLPYRFTYSDDNPTVDDFELHMFEQLWGDTTLGFGGIGGQAMTTAMTYVFIPVSCNQLCFVYFAGRFAYKVPYCDAFINDVRNCNMASVARSGKYRKGSDL